MSRIWVRTVSPNNLHGFRANQLVLGGLREGLNVVFASNATGKSTLAKAIAHMFQPERLDHDATVNGEVWTGEEFVGIARRRKDAKFDGFPGRTRDYLLDLQSLLQGLGDDPQVQELLAQGFKFAEPIKNAPTDTSKEVRVAQERLQALRDARRRKQGLLSEEQRLCALEASVKESSEARKRSEALKVQAQKLRLAGDVGSLRGVLCEMLDQFPGIQQQHPGSEGELEQLQRNLARLQKGLERYSSELGALADGKRPNRPLKESDRKCLESALSELSRNAALLQNNRSRLEESNEQAIYERDCIVRMGPEMDPDALPQITEAEFHLLAQVAELADFEREATTRSNAYRQVRAEWVGDDPRLPDDALEKVQRRLLLWLQTRASDQTAFNLRRAAPYGGLILLCLAIPSLFLRLAVASIGVVGLIYVAWQSKPPSVSKPFLGDLPPPFALENPTEASVAELLNDASLARAKAAVGTKLELLGRVEAPPEDWRGLAESIGLNVRDPYRLRLVAEGVSKYEAALRESASLASETEILEEAREELLDQLRTVYADYGFPCQSGREESLAEEFETWFKLCAQVEEHEIEIQAVSQELATFLTRQGVPGSLTLDERAEIFRDRLPICRQVREASNRIEGLEADLKRLDPDMRLVHESILPDDVSNLDAVEAAIEMQEALSEQLEIRQSSWHELVQKIKLAEEGGSVAEAEANYLRALSKVETRWENACRSSVEYRISEKIRERLMSEDLPPVLEAGNRYLGRFSRGRYRLEFARQPDDLLGALTVYDLLEDRKQAFRHLSTGTKVHVLLALRFALIDEQEMGASGGHRKFPVLCDETMAVSDPESSRAIGEALIDLAKDRQVIVFTSQESDVTLLKHLAPDLHVVGLNQEPVVRPYLDSGLERTLLAPAAHTFDPRVPIQAHSVAAIFGESEPNAGMRIDQITLGRPRLTLTKKLEHLRRQLVVRHPRLSWSDCSGQRWASTGFAPRLQEFLDECSGDPHRFAAALEANRGQTFNRNNVDAATEWLTEHGFLNPSLRIEDLVSLARSALEIRQKDELQHWIQFFAVAFIPGFDVQDWYLSSSAGAAPNAAKIKSEDTAEPNLFEDLARL